MTLEIDWQVPDQIIVARFSGQTTGQDMRLLTGTMPRLLETGAAPHIHWLVDIRNNVQTYTDYDGLWHTLQFLGHPKLCRIAILGETTDPMGNVVISGVCWVFQRRVYRARSMQDAMRFLRGRDGDCGYSPE